MTRPWVLSRSSEKRLVVPKPIDGPLSLFGNTLRATCNLLGFVATALPQLPQWISGWKAWSRSALPKPLNLANPLLLPRKDYSTLSSSCLAVLVGPLPASQGLSRTTARLAHQ